MWPRDDPGARCFMMEPIRSTAIVNTGWMDERIRIRMIEDQKTATAQGPFLFLLK